MREKYSEANYDTLPLSRSPPSSRAFMVHLILVFCSCFWKLESINLICSIVATCAVQACAIRSSSCFWRFPSMLSKSPAMKSDAGLISFRRASKPKPGGLQMIWRYLENWLAFLHWNRKSPRLVLISCHLGCAALSQRSSSQSWILWASLAWLLPRLKWSSQPIWTKIWTYSSLPASCT